MEKTMVVLVVCIFCLMAVESNAEFRITPDGIPSSDDASSVHLSGSFSTGYYVPFNPVGAVVSGKNTYEGSDFSFGGYFAAAGTDGTGVYGSASNTGSCGNYGGYFTAAGSTGTGIYGRGSGSEGTGVYGLAANSGNAANYGGSFTAMGGSGIGVQGYAWNPGRVANYGGHFVANGTMGTGVYGKGNAYSFYADGTGIDYGPFTGAHEVKFSADMPEDILPGLIVSSTGITEVRKDQDGNVSLSSTLPTVTLSKRERDKNVFGVIVSGMPLHKDHWYESKEGERFGVVNALGEGRVWVTDRNGNIEAGDYITTSEIPGHGQMQDDDFLHNYTLGKAIETVDWKQISVTVEHDGETYKRYLIAIVYTSG